MNLNRTTMELSWSTEDQQVISGKSGLQYKSRMKKKRMFTLQFCSAKFCPFTTWLVNKPPESISVIVLIDPNQSASGLLDFCHRWASLIRFHICDKQLLCTGTFLSFVSDLFYDINCCPDHFCPVRWKKFMSFRRKSSLVCPVSIHFICFRCYEIPRFSNRPYKLSEKFADLTS